MFLLPFCTLFWGCFVGLPPALLFSCNLMALFIVFLGLHSQHMQVPKLGVKLKLQLPAYTTATATPYPSCIFDLCCSLQQCQILNPLCEARDWICILVNTSQVLNPLSQKGNSLMAIFSVMFGFLLLLCMCLLQMFGLWLPSGIHTHTIILCGWFLHFECICTGLPSWLLSWYIFYI